MPRNLDVIGTMNTADRSLARLDVALRRRFRFREMMPEPAFIEGENGDGTVADEQGGRLDLRALLGTLNQRIAFLLDRDHTLGHAYFTDVRTFADLCLVMQSKIIPLLQEYFFEDWRRIQLVLADIDGEDTAAEDQLIQHRTVKAEDLFGPGMDDLDENRVYTVVATITSEAIRKIYAS